VGPWILAPQRPQRVVRATRSGRRIPLCEQQRGDALSSIPYHPRVAPRETAHVSGRGFVLTWDGRLDNRNELIAEFRSYLDAEPTDVAIVTAAFDTGRRLLPPDHRRLAVSIWKPEQHELIFALDYMAIRHIFYYLKKDSVSWSTDLAPLVLLSRDTFHIDDDYIAGYFAHDPDAHLTPYNEIREVPPGHFVCVRKAARTPNVIGGLAPVSNSLQNGRRIRRTLPLCFRQAVQRRLRSDSPVLAELSGGLDSSSIVCMADDILAKERGLTPRLDTLSYYDKTEPHGDDWIYFQKIEEKRGRVGAHIDLSKLATDPALLEYPQFNPCQAIWPLHDISRPSALVSSKRGHRLSSPA